MALHWKYKYLKKYNEKQVQIGGIWYLRRFSWETNQFQKWPDILKKLISSADHAHKYNCKIESPLVKKDLH